MKRGLIIISMLAAIFIAHLFLPPVPVNRENHRLLVKAPAFILGDIPFEMKLTMLDSAGQTDSTCNAKIFLRNVYPANAKMKDLNFSFKNGSLAIKNLAIDGFGHRDIDIEFAEKTYHHPIRVIPGILSLLPPIFAIFLALIARRVLVALFSGIWLGATILSNFDPLEGFMRVVDTYLIQSLANPDHVAIVMFSMTLGGMVGVISKSGGTQGIVEKITKFANHRRGGQLATWGLGVLIFFDDYANTLIVGNTMRPFTDKLRISREKLSYIVDSTAAPVASIFPISTWVGYQIALIAGAFAHLKIDQDAYLFFVESIPYAAYSVLGVIFVFLIGMTLRDFGPMLRSEIRSAKTGKVLSDHAVPLADSSGLDIQTDPKTPKRWYNALIPIFTVIFVTLFGLYISGKTSLGSASEAAGFRLIISEANSFHVLMWASVSGAFVAILLAAGQNILTIAQAIDAWLRGVKSMVLAMIILVLAWSIGQICENLMTAQYVIRITESFLSPHYLPLITFIISALIGFATGTSWATMAILIPIVIPIAHKLSLAAHLDPAISHSIMLGTVGAVLSGSVFGDHSSPISDTTIMSSMASGADHVDHVRTQLPYAFTVAVIAILTGYLPAGFGINIYVTLIPGIGILTGILYLFGKPVEEITKEGLRSKA